MKNYRVLMQDEVNGETFLFACTYHARTQIGAAARAQIEFLSASIVSAKLLQQDVGIEK